MPSILLRQTHRPWVALLGGWAVLNLAVNADYPASSVHLAWFTPGWETAAIVGSYALWTTIRPRIPAVVHVGVALLLLVWVTFNSIDSFYRRFFNREFRAALDASLVPEAWTLLVATDGLGRAVLGVGVGGAAVLGLAWLLYRTLKLCASALAGVVSTQCDIARGKHWYQQRRGALVLTTLLVVGPSLASLASQARSQPQRMGPLARAATEFRFFVQYPEIRAAARERFARLSERTVAPATLDGLAGRDVSLIVIESYGRGAVESESHAAVMSSALERLRTRLTARGGATASAWLLPPTYGGGSWFAHATLTTGVKVWSPLDYALLLDSDVVPLSRRMQSYGYHTVNVMPGTTRLWPEGSYFGFDEHMYAWHFDYVGPWLGWGRLPDQLVLDQVRRKALKTEQPVYKEIKLVTSHAPWRAVPTVVEDWETIRDGEIYNGLPAQRFELKWSALEQAHAPYMTTILYDLEVVGQYVQAFEREDALIIILGDHQPLREAALSERWDVPIHVSGPKDLVDRFVQQGFVPGISPATQRPALPMEQFLPLFLSSVAHVETAAAPKRD